jgi:hypothetical protein
MLASKKEEKLIEFVFLKNKLKKERKMRIAEAVYKRIARREARLTLKKLI